MSYSGGLSEKLPEASFMALASRLKTDPLLAKVSPFSDVGSTLGITNLRGKKKKLKKELQPVGMAHVGEVCEGLSVMGGTPFRRRGRV